MSADLVTLRMTKDTVDTILDGLDHLPHGRVRKLYDAVVKTTLDQLEQQRQQQEPEAPAPRRLRKKTAR